MAKLNYKPHFGCLVLVVLFLLPSQPDQRLTVYAEGARADATQQIESAVGGTSTGTEFSTVESVAFENEDAVDGSVGLGVERDEVRRMRRAKTAGGIVAAVVLLVVLHRLLAPSGHAQLREEIAHLRKLEALVPTAEKLGAVVGSVESFQLWSAVEALLPEMKQTLTAAEAKLAEQNQSQIDSPKESYPDTLDRVRDVMSRTSTAIAALHKNALDELARLGDVVELERSAPSGFESLKNEMERLMGADFAEAFVTYAESQEAHVEKMLQESKEVASRSKGKALFANYNDEPLLLATINDYERVWPFVSACGTAETFMKRLESDGFNAIRATAQIAISDTTFRQKIHMQAMNVFFMGEIPGLEDSQISEVVQTAGKFWASQFLSIYSEFQGCKTIKEALDAHDKILDAAVSIADQLAFLEGQPIPDLPAEERHRLHLAVTDTLSNISRFARERKGASEQWRQQLKRELDEINSRNSFCPGMTRTLNQAFSAHDSNVRAAAESAKQAASSIASGSSPRSMYEKTVLAISQDSRAAEALADLKATCESLFLLRLFEDDIAKSLNLISAVKVKDLDPKHPTAKLVISKKLAIEKELAALKGARSLTRIAEATARIREAASSIQSAAHA
ncbi:hypothetical protein ACSSS7_007070 [Eimeria intestinalis]